MDETKAAHEEASAKAAAILEMNAENRALRRALSLMHRRAQRCEGAVLRLAKARRGFEAALANEREVRRRYEIMALADRERFSQACGRYEDAPEKASGSWFSRLFRRLP